MGAKTDKIKGKAQQLEGKLTGDKVRIAQGTVTLAKGQIEGVVDRFARNVKKDVRRAGAGLRRASRARTR